MPVWVWAALGAVLIAGIALAVDIQVERGSATTTAQAEGTRVARANGDATATTAAQVAATASAESQPTATATAPTSSPPPAPAAPPPATAPAVRGSAAVPPLAIPTSAPAATARPAPTTTPLVPPTAAPRATTRPAPTATRVPGKGQANAAVDPQAYADELTVDLIILATALDDVQSAVAAWREKKLSDDQLLKKVDQTSAALRAMYVREVGRDFPPQFKQIDDYYVEGLRAADRAYAALSRALHNLDSSELNTFSAEWNKALYYLKETVNKLKAAGYWGQ